MHQGLCAAWGYKIEAITLHRLRKVVTQNHEAAFISFLQSHRTIFIPWEAWF